MNTNACETFKVSKALYLVETQSYDYYDCEISEKNLALYPEDGPPVVVDYYPSSSNKNPESTSVNHMMRKMVHQKVLVPL